MLAIIDVDPRREQLHYPTPKRRGQGADGKATWISPPGVAITIASPRIGSRPDRGHAGVNGIVPTARDVAPFPIPIGLAASRRPRNWSRHWCPEAFLFRKANSGTCRIVRMWWREA